MRARPLIRKGMDDAFLVIAPSASHALRHPARRSDNERMDETGERIDTSQQRFAVCGPTRPTAAPSLFGYYKHKHGALLSYFTHCQYCLQELHIKIFLPFSSIYSLELCQAMYTQVLFCECIFGFWNQVVWDNSERSFHIFQCMVCCDHTQW